MKNLNVTGLFSRGYMLVQVGRVTFNLMNINDVNPPYSVIVEFEISDDTEEQITVVYDTLLSEIDYHIRSIESEDEEYFDNDLTDDEVEHIKTTYLTELKLIGDLLRWKEIL